MNNELIATVEYLEHERGIDREVLITLIEESLAAAAHRSSGLNNDIKVTIDRKTGDMHAWAPMKVVEKVEDSHKEIILADAKTRNPDAELDEVIDWEVTPANFGRIAAQTAKQAIMQRIKQAERIQLCEEYKGQIGQLITGVVRRLDRRDIHIDIPRTEGVIPYQERIPGDDYAPGNHITALLIKVRSEGKGPSMILSRSHEDFVRRLFEREVSEISEGLVEIRCIAREPGYRSKIAVCTSDSRIDPVGACVGMRGNRVKTVVRELGGEKVDIIEWQEDVGKFVINALQPAKFKSVSVNEAKRLVTVVCDEDQLSLAIGKKGQNARLANKLTGWKVDIHRVEKPKEERFEDKMQHAIEKIAKIANVSTEIAKELVTHGYLSAEGIVEADVSDIASLTGVDNAGVEQIIESAKAFMK